jgi:hypothetical protein
MMHGKMQFIYKVPQRLLTAHSDGGAAMDSTCLRT